jgi:methylated-DNA-[protein]-cysteine S-methyltransferase
MSTIDQSDIATRALDTPVGRLTIVAGPAGVRAIMWDDESAGAAAVATDGPPAATAHAEEACRQLREYFAGERRDFDVALDAVGTPFQRTAWSALRTIPFGETVSYGEQARRMGDLRKARAVGAANGRNPIPIIVPCHRVVGANGSLTGFAGGLGNKAWLLDHERAVWARTAG